MAIFAYVFPHKLKQFFDFIREHVMQGNLDQFIFLFVMTEKHQSERYKPSLFLFDYFTDEHHRNN